MRTPLLVLVGVFLLDWLSKSVLLTPHWALHATDTTWRLTTVPMLLCCALGLLYRPLALAAALALAGGLGNFADARDGVVSNPLIVQPPNTTLLSFNLADVSIVVGCVLLVCATPAIVRDVAGAWEKRKLARA
jgi:lipoprotein signal peptidase